MNDLREVTPINVRQERIGRALKILLKSHELYINALREPKGQGPEDPGTVEKEDMGACQQFFDIIVNEALEGFEITPESMDYIEAYVRFGDNDPRGNPTHPDAKWGEPVIHNSVYIPKPWVSSQTDAVVRAQEMLELVGSEIPPLAVEMRQKLFSEYGGGMEVALTAFAYYAQVVEKCRCEDGNYLVNARDRLWLENKMKEVDSRG